MTTVEIVFPNIQIARMFLAWMSDSGEQHYFQETEDEPYSVDEFKYDLDHLRIITRKEQ